MQHVEVLVPQSGVRSMLPALLTGSLNHSTTRKVPRESSLNKMGCISIYKCSSTTTLEDPVKQAEYHTSRWNDSGR